MPKPILMLKLDSAEEFVKNAAKFNLLSKTKKAKKTLQKFEDAIKTISDLPTDFGGALIPNTKKKAAKHTVKSPVKKKVVKKKEKKVVDKTPLRPSPFKVGDKVWVESSGK